MRGISNYYSFTANVGRLNGYITLILKRSCSKLLAAKFNLRTMKATYEKFTGDLTSPNNTKFVKLSYTATNEFKTNHSPIVKGLYALKSIATLYKLKCAVCGSDSNIEMHHIRKMSDANPKLSKVDNMMVKMNRKQIPLCRNCHMNKHRKHPIALDAVQNIAE